MPYNFDPNKYKNIAQGMFGPNAFDFSQVYKTAQMQAKADMLKQQYSQALSEMKKAQKKAQKEAEKQRKEQEEQQHAEDYMTQKEYYFHSRQWKHKMEALDQEQKQAPKIKTDVKKGNANSTTAPKKKKKNTVEKVLDTIEKPYYGFLNTFNEAVKQGKVNAKKYKHPGDVPKQSVKKITNDFKKGTKKPTSASEVLKTMDVKNKTARNVIGSTADLFLDPINVIPFAGASKLAKIANIAGKAEKGVKALGAGSKVAKVAGISARGATVTGGASAIQQGADALAHPGEQSLKQRLANVGVNTAIGAIGDPLLHGVGKGVSKGIGKIAKPKVDIPKTKFETAATKADPVNFKENVTTHEQMQNVKDISPLQVGTKNIYDLADTLPTSQGQRIKSSLDNAKKSFVDFQEKLTNDLNDKVVKGLGIKKGTKISALVQDYGEKSLGKRVLEKRGVDPSAISKEELDQINLDELKRVAPKDWEKVVKADKYFRNAYDMLLYRVNKTREKIYPNQEDKIVPTRQEYYHHFKELNGFEGFKNLFDTPANIDPHLEGVSPFTKPKSKFQGFMQRRGMGPYKSDAVGGYLKYLQAASHSINIDPVIPVLRQTAKDLADATTDSRNANKIIEALQDHANDLSGKTNPYDRVAQKIIGRKGVQVATWVNSRVKANMVLGNLGSAIGQIGNVPLGIAKAKQYSVPGLINTLSQSAKLLIQGDKNAPIFKSQFLKERYSDQLYRRFDQKLIEQPKKLAAWLMETADKAGTNFIWNSMYAKGLKQKVKDPIKFADSETRKVVAGRGVGEVPLIQKSKTFQVLAPFTLEVGNQWRVLKGMVGEKDAIGIITFLGVAYGLNKVAEELRGSGISFDPIDAVLEGYRKTDGSDSQKVGGAIGSLAGEVIGNIPGGNLITSAVNTDKKVPFTNTKYSDLFVGRNPNRFGSGLTASKVVQDPLYGILPFGASQVRKTTQGIDASRNKAVYKGDNGTIPFNGPKDQLNFPIDTNLKKNTQLGLFGPSSTKEAKEYYDNKRVPLTKLQTKAFKQLQKVGYGDDLYNYLRTSNVKSSDKSKIAKIMKDDKLSDTRKVQKMIQLLQSVKK